MGVQKTPIQKTYKILVGPNSINIDFLDTNRQFHWLQFDWLEISLVFHKSDKHTGLYDSYNVKLPSFTEIYSMTNEQNTTWTNLTQKHPLYKQFID